MAKSQILLLIISSKLDKLSPMKSHQSLLPATILGIVALLFAISRVQSQDYPPSLKTQDGMVMILVPGGEYWVGSDDGPADSRPRHKVSVRAFYMDQTEVTNGFYLKFCLETAHGFPPLLKGAKIPHGAEDLPVVNVSQQDADDYARWAKKSLPAEAQWEAVARGREGLAYPWGNKYKPGFASLRLRSALPVGARKKDASPFGAFDMAGNVMEWTSDWYRSYSGAPKSFDESGKRRVVKGGGFCSRPSDARAFMRRPMNPKTRSDCVGFRCVREIKR